ncbi:MAG TPA: hypothetical protein VG939_05205 [Caulobacteraceae bacterium]|nr:hypothetical protein [Caulobacteraceae bacterium]
MAKSRDDLVAWVRDAGTALAWPFDGLACDPEAFAGLDGQLAAADLVFLGEMDHFIHEKADFRLAACRWLLSRGWTSFAEELAWSDGRRVNAFLAGGDEAAFDRVSLFGWRGDLRDDRDDRPTGLLRASFDAYPVDIMAAEQRRFYLGLAAAANGASVTLHGFDIDGLPGGGYADVLARLEPWNDRPRVKTLVQGLARVAGEAAAEEGARVVALRPLVRALAADTGEAVSAAVAHDLAALAESLDYVARTYGAQSYEALRPGMAFREGCMKRRFADLRAETGGARSVLMAHAMHLAKDDGLLAGTAGAIGPGGGLEPSIGSHLVQERGLKALSIWLVWGAGEDSQSFPDLPRRFAYPKETLNARLGVLETPMLFPIAGAPKGLFDRPIGIGHMYNLVQPTILAGQVDAILWLPSVSPMRPGREP